MNDKDLEVKRHHHYVWAQYLLSWSRGTKKVFFTTKKGKIIDDSVRLIVVEDFFYKITNLNNANLRVIEIFSKFSSENLQREHTLMLQRFLKIQELEKIYHSSGKKNKDIELHLERMRCNGLENMHTAHELSARHVLSALANRDLSVLQDDAQMCSFMAYFGLQITRTKAFRDSILNMLRRNSELELISADATSQAWWFLSYMFGTNIGLSLYLDRKKITHALLINETNIPFITSDQPILNVHEDVSETEFVAPEHADFYYPLSPTVAYIICDSEQFSKGLNFISEEKAFELNKKIASQAMVHLIGDSKEALQPFQKFLGKRHLKNI
ncbi:DUF4238 domain-containing protein [Comamonas thiooxydans]|uniref:DUF4238 domain-containing protein n=1 Tax=Comamonas thiooxydans TaxID=363952 RepID=A0AA42Q0H0_9BURK|nr:DUF4238 domain-containing protein [Comamonas thiooxydans]MDH1334955.1 DUF4238 domain-containing protein [Comamonas thiooxydans]MDH1740964.1 DUF4238 domain-containing protein [Comamonas thiooxydans]MDH1787301.1 DUF4238 domain-containing protein [Comamonas thiooxydans]